MANYKDMWYDMETMDNEDEANLLMECFNAKFINNDSAHADYLKNKFEKEYGYWGNYY